MLLHTECLNSSNSWLCKIALQDVTSKNTARYSGDVKVAELNKLYSELMHEQSSENHNIQIIIAM